LTTITGSSRMAIANPRISFSSTAVVWSADDEHKHVIVFDALPPVVESPSLARRALLIVVVDS
jgi:hypothetical protein